MHIFTSQLTPREQEVYELVITGKCNKEIAFHLDITTRTVRFHLSNIFSKACVTNRIELVCHAANLFRNTSASTMV